MSKTSSRVRCASVAAARQESFLGSVVLDAALLGLFEHLPEVNCFVKNRAGETMFTTRNWAVRHGFQEAVEMLLKTDAEITPGPLAAGYAAADDVVYRTGRPLLGTVELCIDEVGLPDWYVTHKFPLRGRGGRVIGLVGVSLACHESDPRGVPNTRITPATRALQRELVEFPKPARLGKLCGLSVRQLQRCFEESFGISPRTYWMKCRIRAACERLRSASQPIAVVAQELGFCDQSGFTAHFRKHTGQTPRGYRLKAGLK